MNVPSITIFLLRIALGWIFFYSGIIKIMNPSWSAVGFLMNAKTLPEFYQWFAGPGMLPIINFINEWGQFLLGLSLLLGLFVRLSSRLGILLMVLYYLPQLNFPYVGTNYFLVDDHVIFALGLFLLSQCRAGRYLGLETWCANLPICSRYPKLRNFLG